MTKKVEVVFQPEGMHVRIEIGQTILEAAKLAGVDLVSTCGGKGDCGKCRVIVTGRKNIGPLTKIERQLLSADEIDAGYRLACRTIVNSRIAARIPEESRTGKQRLQVEGIKTHAKLDPLIKKYFVKLPSPTLGDNKADVDRLLDLLKVKHHMKDLRVNLRVLQELPPMLRERERDATVVVWNDRVIIGVEPGSTIRRVFGYAVDIGTTKLAGYLLDLTTGEVLAVESLINPQIPYGEDIIARITHALKGPGKQKQLQQLIITALNQILKALLEKSGVRTEEVYEMTVVGNTAMHHLFLNICPKGLALSPYAPAVRTGLDINPKEVGMRMNPHGNIHVLPVVAGFVGADAIAVALATEVYKRSELCLALDIGTNTEILLGNKDGLMACSCASGPALEGAHIKHGMRAQLVPSRKCR